MNARLKRVLVIATCTVFAVFGAQALAHTTVTNNGMSVTIHVSPEDEPVAGETSTIKVTKMKPRSGTFSWSTCNCRIKISDSSGATLKNSSLKTIKTTFKFPDEGAYKVTISGRYKQGTKYKTFKANFSYRAS